MLSYDDRHDAAVTDTRQMAGTREELVYENLCEYVPFAKRTRESATD